MLHKPTNICRGCMSDKLLLQVNKDKIEWTPPCTLFYSINTLQCPALKVSTTTCAAALELPNLSYVHGELTFRTKT